jgi:hypothetical protein
MAYDRYDTRRERGRYPDYDRERGRREDRGFFERAGDEIASWFGDDEAERRRREDERMNREGGWGRERDFDRDRYNYGGWGGDPNRDRFASRSYRRDRFEDEDRGYRSSFGDRGLGRGYGASGWSGAFTGSDYDRRDFDRGGYDRSESPWGRDDYRRTSFAGSTRDSDRHYQAWRQRQLNELDRDFDEYNRERQERFENDFGTWRKSRQRKRGFLGQIREHMDVVGSDGETIGKVDCVRGDHIVLTKSDSDDNRHHSIRCTMIDTVEGDEVRLDRPAEEVKSRWEDAENRGFFGRDEDTSLERSFSGTYR